MNIDCTKWRELASDYIEGTLPTDMKQAVTLHLRGCHQCRQDEAALQAIGRELNVLPEVDPPLFFRENLISTIERSSRRPVGTSWWQSLWGGYGRLIVGSSLTLSVASAIAFALISPQFDHSGKRQMAGITSTEIVANTTAPTVVGNAPDLHFTKVTTVLPGEGVAWDFSFNLENASTGTARIKIDGVDQVYRFPLSGTTEQRLRVPAQVLADRKLLEIQADWTAAESGHTRTLFYPVTSGGEPVAEVRQSFALPEYSVVEIAREIAERFRVPVILDDVSTRQTMRLTAANETAEETLRRNLSELLLSVRSANDGIHISSSASELSGRQ